MRLEHLQYLMEIDRHHSISAAARSLYMGQTTLSAILKGLEEELGFSIFRRTPNGVVATAEGEEAISLAWEILSRFEEVKGLNQQSKTSSRPVSLLASPSINCGLALPVSRAFLELEPYGCLVFNETTGGEVGAGIIQNDANIGLTYYVPTVQDEYRATAAKYQIQVSSVFHDHLYLLMRPDHPLAERGYVDVSEVEHMQLAMLTHFRVSEDSQVFRWLLRGDNRFTTFSNVPLIKRAVAEQNILSVLSGFAIHYDTSMDPRRFRAVLLTGLDYDNRMNLCLLHRTNRNLRYLEKVALRCIEDYFADLLPPPFSPEAARNGL